MKRLLLTLSCIISIIWLMPCFVHASYTAPDGNEYEYKVNSSTGNYNTRYFTIYSNQKLCTVTSQEYSGGKVILGLFPTLDNSSCLLGLGCKSGTVNMQSAGGSSWMYPADARPNYNAGDIGYYCWRNNSTTPDINNALTDYNCTNDYTNLPNFSTLADAYDYLTAQEIDYDTVYYSPLIPSVDFSVVLNTSGVPVNDINSTEYNAFNVNINSDVGTDYKIQIGYKVHVPNKMALGVNSNGSAYYSALTYNAAAYQDIYSLQDNQVSFTGAVNNSLFAWTRQAVSSDNWNIVSSLQGNTSFINGSIMAYNDTMSYILPLYGKKLEIFMRYYVIQDGQIIVGAWSHWNNSYPSQYTQELPSNYIPYHDVPGYEQTNTNTELQENTNTISSLGTETGSTNNISIYNSSVPNYPNYPTIQTYNHDNIILKFFDTAIQLPSHFNGFTSFLSVSFAWIPSYVWDIIAFGLLASITVMIVKVL